MYKMSCRQILKRRITHWATIIALLVPLFHLGMSRKQAQAICPHELMPLYHMLHGNDYMACDDGKNTTVLIFNDKGLNAIMSVEYFASHEDK